MAESKVLFENNLIERFSRTNCYLVITLYYISAIAIIIIGGMKLNTHSFIQLIHTMAGLTVFSLMEYLIHRFLFHSKNSDDMNSWTYKLHNIHHDHPRDKKRLALPLPLGIIFGTLLYLFMWIFLGSTTPFFFSGFIIGYGTYLLVHYRIHIKKPPKNILKYWWKHHHIHHYKDRTKAYGVTTPLWDVIFGTLPKTKK